MTDKPISSQFQSKSYIEFRFDIDGKQSALFLRMPSFWDAVNNCWIAALKFSDGKLLWATGQSEFELQNSANRVLASSLKEGEHKDELFNMFKPLEYWEKVGK